MYRDFSDASKQRVLGLVSEVENDKLCDLTDWIGDRWYDFESWIGRLNIRNYINDVNSYHKKVIDKNNATKDSIETIFNNVSNVNTTYGTIMGNIDVSLGKISSYIDAMNTIVTPSNGMFESNAMSSKFDSLLKEMNTSNVQCLKDQMVQNVDGELIFNEDLIYEYLKKDQAQLSEEEQEMLIDVIATLQETVAIYETLASVGTDELGVDVLHYVSWMAEDTKYDSFTAVSAHYNEFYTNLLNFMVEQDESSNSFAASILKASNGEYSLTILGAECKEKLDSLFGGESVKIYTAKFESKHTEHYFAKLEASEKESLKTDGLGKKESNKRNKEIKEKLESSGKRFDTDIKPKYYDVFEGEISKKDAPKFYKKEITLAELKKSVSANVSIYDGTFDTFGDGSVEVVIGRAEAHANISAGLYTLDNNGEKKFSPGVNAEVGASVTALDVEWEQQWLGDEMLGFNTDVEVKAGDVGAKADIGAQIYGEDGKLDLQLGTSAKAEAIAAELEATGGVNILGGEVGVSGSVNFGIGAHADVGFKDWVFKFDIGASIGVGVSVGAEVDIGGMVDTVCDKAESAWQGLKKGWKTVTSWF
jgi:hypothetical protein